MISLVIIPQFVCFFQCNLYTRRWGVKWSLHGKVFFVANWIDFFLAVFDCCCCEHVFVVDSFCVTLRCAYFRVEFPHMWWLVWRSGNVVRHINEVQLHRARLVLGLVTTLGGSTIPIFFQATQDHSAWPSLRGYVRWVPDMVSAISEKKL